MHREPPAAIPGKPKLTFKGLSLDQIPGVSKGFVPSAARETENEAYRQLFRHGDKVRHPKFGEAIAPIVKAEEEE